MRAFSVPTLSGGVVAVVSLAYFSVANRVMGDSALAAMMIAMAEAAVVQAFFIPRTWLFVLSGGQSSIKTRMSSAAVIEVLGGSVGLLILCAVGWLRELSDAAAQLRVACYLSLWVPSLTSAVAVYRIEHRWSEYFLWIAGSACLRLPLLLLAEPHLQPSNTDTATLALQVTVISYLLPELARLATGFFPLMYKRWRRPAPSCIFEALRQITANWRFDVVSSAVDSLDKVVIGWAFSPQVFVCYFFARRIAGVIPMVLEPYYAYVYQSYIERRHSCFDRRFAWTHYIRAILISAMLAGSMTVSVHALSSIALSAPFVPTAVQDGFIMFSAILALDALLGANRWYRYATQYQGSNVLVLLRATGFAAFTGVVALTEVTGWSTTPVYAFSIFALLDTLALIYILQRLKSA